MKGEYCQGPKVTPEMIEAGLEVFFANYPETADGGVIDRLMVTEMFLAMMLAVDSKFPHIGGQQPQYECERRGP